MLLTLDGVADFPKYILILHIFSVTCSAWLLSITLSSRSLIDSSAPSILPFIPSSVFLICYCVLPLWLVISVLRISLMSSILCLSPVSIFMIITLNSLSDMLPLFHLCLLLWFLSCSLIWDIFCCPLICLTLCVFLCLRKVIYVSCSSSGGWGF